MIILSVESSCDETAVALVRDGREVLTDQVFSQADLHAVYGGVVPEIASRSHIEVIYQQNHPRPNGPYGASGCGEAPLDAPHPAILNAIYNATGARITRVPALPEVVLEALKKVNA